MIEGIIIIIILLIVISVTAGKKLKTVIDVKHYEGQGMTVESKEQMEIIGYQPIKYQSLVKYPPKKE